MYTFVVAKGCAPTTFRIKMARWQDNTSESTKRPSPSQVLKSEPGNLQALTMRATAYFYLADHDMAKRHCGEVLAHAHTCVCTCATSTVIRTTTHHDVFFTVQERLFRVEGTSAWGIRAIASAAAETTWPLLLRLACPDLAAARHAGVQVRPGLFAGDAAV